MAGVLRLFCGSDRLACGIKEVDLKKLISVVAVCNNKPFGVTLFNGFWKVFSLCMLEISTATNNLTL
jgi:hypothetical protein